MVRPKNISEVKPNVTLTGKIKAFELLAPNQMGNKLSSHLINIPPNEEYPPHIHPAEHVILLIKGSGYARFWKEKKVTRFTLKKGDFFYVPQKTPHQVGAFSKGAIMLAVSVDSLSIKNSKRLKVVKV